MSLMSAPAIMIVTYLVIEILKILLKNKEKYLLVIAGVIGLVSYIFVPGFLWKLIY